MHPEEVIAKVKTRAKAGLSGSILKSQGTRPLAGTA